MKVALFLLTIDSLDNLKKSLFEFTREQTIIGDYNL